MVHYVQYQKPLLAWLRPLWLVNPQHWALTPPHYKTPSLRTWGGGENPSGLWLLRIDGAIKKKELEKDSSYKQLQWSSFVELAESSREIEKNDWWWCISMHGSSATRSLQYVFMRTYGGKTEHKTKQNCTTVVLWFHLLCCWLIFLF